MKKKVKFNSFVEVKYFHKDQPIYNRENSKKKIFIGIGIMTLIILLFSLLR